VNTSIVIVVVIIRLAKCRTMAGSTPRLGVTAFFRAARYLASRFGLLDRGEAGEESTCDIAVRV